MENGNSVTTTSEVQTSPKPYPNEVKMVSIIEDVMVELHQAMAGAAPMHSLHEGLSVIEEEAYELMLEVYKNGRKHPNRNELARKEAIQVAAMAIRLLHDIL